MSVALTPPPDVASDRPRRAAWRWVHVAVAALAMVLTLPGRTQGLGLFTEPLLRSLSLDRESYGFLNLWATLLGALFCLPCGWLLDRLGTRTVLLGVTTLLGVAVVAMSWWTTGAAAFTLALDLPSWLGGAVRVTVPVDLFVFLLLTRGLGQSALSVVSLALIGRAAGRQPGPAMGVFAVLTALGFMAAFAVLGRPNEWRPAWAGVGVAVLLLGPVAALLVRNQFLQADPAQGEAVPSDRGELSSRRCAAQSDVLDLQPRHVVFGHGPRRHVALRRIPRGRARAATVGPGPLRPLQSVRERGARGHSVRAGAPTCSSAGWRPARRWPG